MGRGRSSWSYYLLTQGCTDELSEFLLWKAALMKSLNSCCIYIIMVYMFKKLLPYSDKSKKVVLIFQELKATLIDTLRWYTLWQTSQVWSIKPLVSTRKYNLNFMSHLCCFQCLIFWSQNQFYREKIGNGYSILISKVPQFFCKKKNNTFQFL